MYTTENQKIVNTAELHEVYHALVESKGFHQACKQDPQRRNSDTAYVHF